MQVLWRLAYYQIHPFAIAWVEVLLPGVGGCRLYHSNSLLVRRQLILGSKPMAVTWSRYSQYWMNSLNFYGFVNFDFILLLYHPSLPLTSSLQVSWHLVQMAWHLLLRKFCPLVLIPLLSHPCYYCSITLSISKLARLKPFRLIWVVAMLVAWQLIPVWSSVFVEQLADLSRFNHE